MLDLRKNGQYLKLKVMNLTFLVLGTPSGESFYGRRKLKKKNAKALPVTSAENFPMKHICSSHSLFCRYY